MGRTNKIAKFEEVHYLPHWAYHKDEWKELIESIDKIVNGKLFRLINEPEKDKLDEFINSIKGL